MIAHVLSALLALTAPGGIVMATPDGSGPVSLAVIVVPPGGELVSFLGAPSAAGGGRAEVTGSLFEHRRVHVGRILSGPRVPGRVTIRQVYPDTAAMYRGLVRRLAFLERTGGGYWHVQWQTLITRGRACLPPAVIARFRVRVPRRAPDRNGEICFNL